MNALVIGFGKAGMIHAAILPFIPGIREVTLAESAPFIADGLRRANPALKVYRDYRVPLESGQVSLAVIATPTATHLPILKDCLERGIPTFVEKPFVVSHREAAEAREWRRSVSPSCPVMVGYCLRFLSTFEYAREVLAHQALGRLQHFEAKAYASSVEAGGAGWRFERHAVGGGATLELGSHLVDLVRSYFGVPQQLSAVTRQWVSRNVEDYFHARFHYAELFGTVEASWSMPGYRKPYMEVTVFGTNGVLSASHDVVRVALKEPAGAYPTGTHVRYAIQLNRHVPFNVGGPLFTHQLEEFVNAVARRAGHRNTLDESLEDHQILDAILSSEGNPVSLQS